MIFFKARCTDPLLTASKILAINPPAVKYKRIYTMVFSLVFIGLAYDVGIFFNDSNGDLSVLVNFSLWLQLVGLTVIVFADFLTVLIRPKNFLSPKKNLKKIEARLKLLGFKVRDEILVTRLGVLQIFASFFIPFGFGFIDLTDIIKGRDFPHLLIYFSHYVFALTVINVTELLFVNYLNMIKRRFRELNRILLIMIQVEDNDEQEENAIFEKLHLAKKAHYDLTEIAKKVNKSYGFHLLLSIIFSIILITEQLYQNYEAIVWYERTLIESIYTNYTWITYHITRVSLIIFTCYSTSVEANKTAPIIHSIPIARCCKNLLENEIFHFSLQIQEELHFSAADFFVIDLSTLTKVIGTVVTYLLIMIQMAKVNQASCNN